jgi:hypothetical protein
MRERFVKLTGLSDPLIIAWKAMRVCLLPGSRYHVVTRPLRRDFHAADDVAELGLHVANDDRPVPVSARHGLHSPGNSSSLPGSRTLFCELFAPMRHRTRRVTHSDRKDEVC